jgi:DNA-binding CsgD family transcriptional regulator
MLVGYEAERARLRTLCREARNGAGEALVLLGNPGMGKTALCDEVADDAVGLSVLRAVGVEAERSIAFAGLHALTAPVVDRIDSLPDPQASALRGALALGGGRSGDRLALGVATHALLCEVGPVLAVVDDAQWLDPSSLGLLAFAARRTAGSHVAILFASRSDPAAERELGGLPRLELTGLDPVSSERLLGAAAGVPVPRRVALRVHAACRGAPLMLLEVAAALPVDMLAGRQPLAEPLPLQGTLLQHYAARLADLPTAARTALLVAAVTDRGEPALIRTALRALGVDLDALAPAAQAGLVHIDQAVRFTHPLVRSASYHAARPAQRRRVHRVVADALVADPERRVWHLGQSVDAPDGRLAAELDAAAVQTAERGGFLEAARLHERAAALAEDPAQRDHMLVAAAHTSHLGGHPDHGAQLLDAVLDRADAGAGSGPSGPDRMAAVLLRAEVDMWRGRPRAALERLLAVAGQAGEVNPAAMNSMWLQASAAASMLGEFGRALHLADRAYRGLTSGDPLQPLAAAMLSEITLLLGDRDRGLRLLDEVGEARLVRTAQQSMVFHYAAASALVLSGRLEDAERRLSGLVARARTSGALATLPMPLTALAMARLTAGRLHAAAEGAEEAVVLATDTGNVPQRSHSMAILARVEALRGEVDACTRHAKQVLDDVAAHGGEAMISFAEHALGLLYLGVGDLDPSVAHSEAARRCLAAQGIRHLSAVPVTPDLVEALVRAHRSDEAAIVAVDVEAEAERTGDVWDRGMALRCRGLVDGDPDALDASLPLLAEVPAAVEVARSHLCLGELLRRRQARFRARDHLHEALAAFDRQGARPWAQRARDELRLTGAREPEPAPVSLLTAQELRIARLVARGATNREVAGELFLSPKTVESHLTRIYKKLGVRSRTELAGRVATIGRASRRSRA